MEGLAKFTEAEPGLLSFDPLPVPTVFPLCSTHNLIKVGSYFKTWKGKKKKIAFADLSKELQKAAGRTVPHLQNRMGDAGVRGSQSQDSKSMSHNVRLYNRLRTLSNTLENGERLGSSLTQVYKQSKKVSKFQVSLQSKTSS